ncbi:MAG: secretin N-terminal domain-containing protein [Phycisphaerae bacterium]
MTVFTRILIAGALLVGGRLGFVRADDPPEKPASESAAPAQAAPAESGAVPPAAPSAAHESAAPTAVAANTPAEAPVQASDASEPPAAPRSRASQEAPSPDEPVDRGDAPRKPPGVFKMTSDKRVTLELVNADIGDALRMLAKQGGLSLVVGPDVKAEISVSLVDVPVMHALRTVVEGNGYAWKEANGIITVAKPAPPDPRLIDLPPKLVTRIIRLRSVNATLLVQALQPALSKWGRLSILSEDSVGTFQQQFSGTAFRSATSTNVNVSGAGASGSAPGGGNAFGSGAPPAGSPSPGGTSQTGVMNSQVLLVTDSADRVAAIEKLVADLDVPPRQVLIEARIVEMTVELQKRLGIDWNVEAFANGPLLNHEVPLFWRADFATGPARQIRNGSGPNLALGTVDFSRFTALLQASQDDNGVRLLANPRMLVFNNHAANLLVGEQYPILASTITDQGTATESLLQYIPVGIQLQVTPTIMSDGRVSLLVRPSTSAIGDDVVGTTGLRIARILTREIETRVVMRDGDTVVLGGLISDRKTNMTRKVPGLGDIPIIDIFTRQERPRIDRVDLLVFLSVNVEKAAEVSEEEKGVYERYRPRFKHADGTDAVPLHFEFPFTQFHDEKLPRPPAESIDDPHPPAAPPVAAAPHAPPQSASPDAPQPVEAIELNSSSAAPAGDESPKSEERP